MVSNDALGWFDTPDSGRSEGDLAVPMAAPPPLVRRDAISHVDATPTTSAARDDVPAADPAPSGTAGMDADPFPPPRGTSAADETFDVLAARGADGRFGLSIADDNFIDHIKPGSRADKEKELLAGDEIVAINGVPLPAGAAFATMMDDAESYYLFTVRRRPTLMLPAQSAADAAEAATAGPAAECATTARSSGRASATSMRTTSPAVPRLDLSRRSLYGPTPAPSPVAAPTATPMRRRPARTTLMPLIRKLLPKRRARRPIDVVVDTPFADQTTPPTLPPNEGSSLSPVTPGLIAQLLDTSLYGHGAEPMRTSAAPAASGPLRI